MTKKEHEPRYQPHCEVDYEPAEPGHHHSSPPENPRYPDPRFYGDYASRKPPAVCTIGAPSTRGSPLPELSAWATLPNCPSENRIVRM